MSNRYILGLDPGSCKTGFSVINIERNKVHLLDAGVWRPKSKDYNLRLAYIYEQLDILLLKHDLIQECAIERIFIQKNISAAIKLGQARGALLACLGKHKLSIHEYTPREIKLALTGFGNADKLQIIKMVQIIMNKKLAEDAADATAGAYCHYIHTKYQAISNIKK